MTQTMEESPVLCAESYPNECWLFCNAIAASAILASDALDGSDHSALLSRWLESVRTNLTDPETGLLVSSFAFNGSHLDGPEGSSIWLIAHCLALFDQEYAADQYGRARRELARQVFGFGYSREWPLSWKGPADIDSGPIIPILNISAGASGLAFVGAASFHDYAYVQSLLRSLHFGGFPEQEEDGLRFHASNQVGDAVLLYAMVQGPMWEEIRRRRQPGDTP